MAFFHNTDSDAVIECIPTCVADGETPKYQPITCGDYLSWRFEKAFAYRSGARGD